MTSPTADTCGVFIMTVDEPSSVTWTTLAEALRLFVRGATLRAGVPVSLVVGTILSIVNQGDKVVGGTATTSTWIRIGVNYLVPFLVSSYGFLAACREHRAA
jgi:hypothetical protein